MSSCDKRANEEDRVHASVKDYYGKTLKKSDDLATNVCTTPTTRLPKYVREALKLVHDEVASKYYGCGIVIPPCLHGAHVLDLGSGSGRDCYALSKLVGETGQVTGLDMTEEQVAVARKHIDYHAKVFGYAEPNTDFVLGYIERPIEAGIKENNYDLVISNCVVNLVPDKRAALGEIYKVLKDGGEFYFSDLYANCDLPDNIRKHEVLWGECISGALYWKDLGKIAEEVGFSTPMLISSREISINSKSSKLRELVGDYKFVSAEYRLFKCSTQGDGKPVNVVYKGELEGLPDEFILDKNISFKKDEPLCVSGNLAVILKCSRYRDEFKYEPAPCCATESQVAAVNPFDVAVSEDAKVCGEGGPSCCA
ncbi:PREDICTED: arsenite methyltransferase-like [Priapulus caudatus]|uniref:Arsenite methyltransferase n=1 Tax=Priapulus caudatus TaxID=37621 RepID=A0ABM1F1N4_PRICU|nr:PREDICTED: arsenite methyltransferase-like [Priapulus caudatus]